MFGSMPGSELLLSPKMLVVELPFFQATQAVFKALGEYSQWQEGHRMRAGRLFVLPATAPWHAQLGDHEFHVVHNTCQKAGVSHMPHKNECLGRGVKECHGSLVVKEVLNKNNSRSHHTMPAYTCLNGIWKLFPECLLMYIHYIYGATYVRSCLLLSAVHCPASCHDRKAQVWMLHLQHHHSLILPSSVLHSHRYIAACMQPNMSPREKACQSACWDQGDGIHTISP